MMLFGSTNTFRLLANSIHLVAMLVPIVSMLRSKSCAGISGKTQILYAIVFSTRYADLFFSFVSWYNTITKILFLLLTYFTIFLIYWSYRNKENLQQDSFRAEFLVIFTFGLAFFLNYEFVKFEIAWSFSEYLEAVVILPQLYMSWKSKYYAVCVVLYIRLLTVYRSLYIANWIYRYSTEYYTDEISVISGSIQTVILFGAVWILRPKKEKTVGKELLGQLKMNAPGKCQAVVQSDPSGEPVVSTDPLDVQDEEKVVPTVLVASVPDTDQLLDSTDKTPLFTSD